jgi:hypothetical protein
MCLLRIRAMLTDILPPLPSPSPSPPGPKLKNSNFQNFNFFKLQLSGAIADPGHPGRLRAVLLLPASLLQRMKRFFDPVTGALLISAPDLLNPALPFTIDG